MSKCFGDRVRLPADSDGLRLRRSSGLCSSSLRTGATGQPATREERCRDAIRGDFAGRPAARPVDGSTFGDAAAPAGYDTETTVGRWGVCRRCGSNGCRSALWTHSRLRIRGVAGTFQLTAVGHIGQHGAGWPARDSMGIDRRRKNHEVGFPCVRVACSLPGGTNQSADRANPMTADVPADQIYIDLGTLRGGGLLPCELP